MTRGNQRELARERNAKKNDGHKKASEQPGNKGLNLLTRKERDAEAIRIKQQKAAEKKAMEDAAAAGKSK